jgi:hypothetical protein
MKIQTIFAVSSVLVGAQAFAASDTGLEIGSQGVGRFDSQAEVLKISGQISCVYATDNQAQACQLKLVEANTGKTFELQPSHEVMSLLSSGKAQVAIEGRVADDRKIEVLSIHAL